MTTPPIHELTDRARDVFRIVVDSYLDTGAPVGSRTISKISALNLSPASIRNVMQDLEELGLLAAPHTSAGRMPTETGLRLFVDGMMQANEPSPEERAAIEARAGQVGPVEEALASTTLALSGLSACAGLVLVPKSEPVLRQFSFVPLGDTRALAVLVGDDGSVENRVVELPGGVDPGALLLEIDGDAALGLAERHPAEHRVEIIARLLQRARIDPAGKLDDAVLDRAVVADQHR
ncbi:MAG: heat-inducible transcriptional repressor HrcA, partial [Sphingomonadales bacterium]